MTRRRPGSNSRSREWHARLEQYTPDGSLGRFLLGAPTGTMGFWLLLIALLEIPRGGISLGVLFWTPALLGASILMLLFAVLMVWPIYLSLIGNIASTEAYAESITGKSKSPSAASVGGTTKRTDPTTGATPANRGQSTRNTGATRSASESADTDTLEQLKQQYAAGKISEDEFERRLEAHIGGTSKADTNPASEDDVELTERR